MVLPYLNCLIFKCRLLQSQADWCKSNIVQFHQLYCYTVFLLLSIISNHLTQHEYTYNLTILRVNTKTLNRYIMVFIHTFTTVVLQQDTYISFKKIIHRPRWFDISVRKYLFLNTKFNFTSKLTFLMDVL